GSTAGYRAFLARYPERDLSVALLCNIGSVNPGNVGQDVADIFLGEEPPQQQAGGRGRGGGGGGGGRGGRGAGPPAAPQLTPAQLQAYSGEFYSPDAETTLQLVVEDGQLVALRRPAQRIPFRPT